MLEKVGGAGVVVHLIMGSFDKGCRWWEGGKWMRDLRDVVSEGDEGML